MSRWPRDNQAALLAYYGTPGANVEGQLVAVTPPFSMFYEGKLVRTIKFHSKAAPSLRAALVKIWDYYGRDQKKIDALGISKYAGAYNPRKIRGSATKWSNHAYGAAIDLNAEQNGFNTGHGNMPLPVVAAFKSEGARWGGDYKGRTDPMHFEFCDAGQPVRTFEQWLAFYKCPPAPGAAKPKPAEPAPAPVVAKPKPVAAPPERIQPEDGPPSQPAKSMATSKIGNAQIVAGTVTTVAAGAQVAKPFLESTTETVTAINDIATPVGTLVETTKTVTTAVPDSVWVTIIHALTSPAFIACAVLVVVATTGLTWYWRRQHRQAGV